VRSMDFTAPRWVSAAKYTRLAGHSTRNTHRPWPYRSTDSAHERLAAGRSVGGSARQLLASIYVWAPMLDTARMLVFLHVASNLVWVGAIASVGVVVASAHASPRDRGKIALIIYRWLATPAMLGSLMMGLLRLVLSLDFYFVQTKFMHGKLLFAVGAIALHHLLGRSAKRMASGTVEAASHSRHLAGALVVCAVCAAFFAMVKPF